MTSLSKEQGVFARATAGIENGAANLVGDVDERFLRLSPAMAAGITPRLWSFNDLMNA